MITSTFITSVPCCFAKKTKQDAGQEYGLHEITACFDENGHVKYISSTCEEQGFGESLAALDSVKDGRRGETCTSYLNYVKKGFNKGHRAGNLSEFEPLRRRNTLGKAHIRFRFESLLRLVDEHPRYIRGEFEEYQDNKLLVLSKKLSNIVGLKVRLKSFSIAQELVMGDQEEYDSILEVSNVDVCRVNTRTGKRGGLSGLSYVGTRVEQRHCFVCKESFKRMAKHEDSERHEAAVIKVVDKICKFLTPAGYKAINKLGAEAFRPKLTDKQSEFCNDRINDMVDLIKSDSKLFDKLITLSCVLGLENVAIHKIVSASSHMSPYEAKQVLNELKRQK